MPSIAIVRRAPSDPADHGRDGTGAARPIVEHRIGQALIDKGNFAPVTSGNRQQRRMPSARAFTHYGNPLRVGADLLGIVMEPAQPAIIVLDRAGIAGFGCEPVIHRDDYAIECFGDLLQAADRLRGGSEDEPAAMGI